MNKKAPASVEKYIASFPSSVQLVLRKIREIVRREAPDATEKICYGIPTFYLHQNLVHYAAFKEHISFFPTSSGIVNFQNELAGYKCSRGTIRFPNGTKIPYKLIAKIVRFRVQEATSIKK